MKTKFGNLNIVREWNCVKNNVYFLLRYKLKANDYILSNGRPFSGIQMMKYAFEFFDLNYKDYIETSKSFLRKKILVIEFQIKVKFLKSNQNLW